MGRLACDTAAGCPARRAWEAGVRFHLVERATVTLYDYGRRPEIDAALDAMGLPPSAAGA